MACWRGWRCSPSPASRRRRRGFGFVGLGLALGAHHAGAVEFDLSSRPAGAGAGGRCRNGARPGLRAKASRRSRPIWSAGAVRARLGVAQSRRTARSRCRRRRRWRWPCVTVVCTGDDLCEPEADPAMEPWLDGSGLSAARGGQRGAAVGRPDAGVRRCSGRLSRGWRWWRSRSQRAAKLVYWRSIDAKPARLDAGERHRPRALRRSAPAGIAAHGRELRDARDGLSHRAQARGQAAAHRGGDAVRSPGGADGARRRSASRRGWRRAPRRFARRSGSASSAGCSSPRRRMCRCSIMAGPDRRLALRAPELAPYIIPIIFIMGRHA